MTIFYIYLHNVFSLVIFFINLSFFPVKNRFLLLILRCFVNKKVHTPEWILINMVIIRKNVTAPLTRWHGSVANKKMPGGRRKVGFN